MLLIENNPSRFYNCGLKKPVIIEHKYNIFIKPGDDIFINSELMDIFVRNKVWGLKIKYFPYQ